MSSESFMYVQLTTSVQGVIELEHLQMSVMFSRDFYFTQFCGKRELSQAVRKLLLFL